MHARPATKDRPPILKIGIVLYDGFDSLDVAGPHQVFYFLVNMFSAPHTAELYLISPHDNLQVTSFENLTWLADTSYKKAPSDLDVLFVPGGANAGFGDLLANKDGLFDPFYRFLKEQVSFAEKAKKPQLICSVCTGALLLARAGFLESYTCTTHWAFKNVLSLFPGVSVAPGFPRYVVDRNRVTGGGISSGLDEALAIVEILRGSETAGQIQLMIQYSPNPPANSGNPAVASAQTLHTVSQKLDDAIAQTYNLVKNIIDK